MDAATLSWIQKQVASGYPREQLEKYLREQGYSEADIANAFSGTKAATSVGPKKPIGLYIMLIILLVSTLGLLALYINKSSKASDMEFEVLNKGIVIESLRSDLDNDAKLLDDCKATNRGLQEKIDGLVKNLSDATYEIDQLKSQTCDAEVTVNETSEVNDTEPEWIPPVTNFSNSTLPLYFPNSSIDWSISKDLIPLKVAAFNEKYDGAWLKGRIFCFNDYDEEFDILELDCQYVEARDEAVWTPTLTQYLTDQVGERNCFVETFEVDETCEEPQGQFNQVKFVMLIME